MWLKRLSVPHLVADAARTIGVAEVRHQRDFINLWQRVQPRPGGPETLGGEAQPVHARVHFQENAVRHMGFVRRQHVDLLVAMHGVPQLQPRAKFQVACFKHAFQQQNRAASAQGAHTLGFVEVQQGTKPSALRRASNTRSMPWP